MIRLFKNIFLEDDELISPRYEMLSVSSLQKEHPLTEVFNQPVGTVTAFEKLIEQSYRADIENFWQELIAKNHPRPFVIFADTDLFLKLLFSYWKSVFANKDIKFFFQLYHLFRVDIELKLFAPIDSTLKARKQNTRAYPLLTLDQFSKIFEPIPDSSQIKNLSPGFLPVEYLIAEFYLGDEKKIEPFIKKQILDLAWINWCRDINALKTEVLAGFFNIETLFKNIKIPFTPDFQPNLALRSYSELHWLMDTDISPQGVEYIKATYPKAFFPGVQSQMDKICHVETKIKDQALENLEVFNQASQTEDLYSENFKNILEKDVQRGFGSFFLKDDLHDKVNHFLLNYLYKLIRDKNLLELSNFKLR